MTAAIQSKPEDVDAWTRAYAEEQARRAGVPVREWLDRFVIEQSDHAEASVETLAVDASYELEVMPSPPETIDGARAADPLPDDDIARVLERQLAQLDAAEAAPAEPRDDPAMRLGDIETALQQIAAEQGPGIVAGGHAEAESSAHPPAELPRSSIGAIEGLSLEFARLAEVVDCGLERIEAITANEMAELRGEVAQLFDGLAARVDTVERRSVGSLDADLGDDLHEPDVRLEEPVHLTVAAAPEPDPAVAEPPGNADSDHADSFSLHALSADPPSSSADLETGDETWDSLFEPTPIDAGVAEQPQAPQGKNTFFPWRFGQTKRLLRSA